VRHLIVALLCLFSAAALAHEVRPAFLQISGHRPTGDGAAFTASFRQPQLDGRYLGLRLVTNCDQTITGASLTEGALTEEMRLDCPDAGLAVIEIANLERTLIDTLVSIVQADGSTLNYLITADQPSLALDSKARGLPVYLSIGFEHLLLGYDHILFVLMLLYLVQTPAAIFRVVTCFTLAHSLTLGLSAMNLVRLSQPAVEAVIAASIVLLAYEILTHRDSVTSRHPGLIAFSFGLLHGLGFAGALAEIGLPEGGRLAALFLFNVGIELGQLAIIAAVVGLLVLARRRSPQLVYQLPVYIAGGLASFWFMERALMIAA
jgi:hydrogenase/urease accessory protein HupE